MIDLGARGRVFVHRAPCDMRKHYVTLWGLVVETMKHDVLSGDVFVFISKTWTRTPGSVACASYPLRDA